MNRPTDKQIEEVLAGIATPEDAKFVAEWFATEEGLNKFDGTRFITYYKNDLAHNNQGITGNELNRVYADTKRPIIG